MRISKAAKTVVAAVGTVVTGLSAAFADDVLSVDETGNLVATIIAGVLTVAAVWRVPNRPDEGPTR